MAQTRNRFEKYNPEQLDLAKLAHEKSLEFIRRFVAAGGILKEGSDPPQGMAGLQMHIGMAMDVEAGVPPMTAIQAATLNAAKTFKKEKDFGSVEAGKVADLAIVEGDPLKDIWVTQNVKMVVMNGKVVDIGFHADWRNPIPAALPGHSVPQGNRNQPGRRSSRIGSDGLEGHRQRHASVSQGQAQRKRPGDPFRERRTRGSHSASSDRTRRSLFCHGDKPGNRRATLLSRRISSSGSETKPSCLSLSRGRRGGERIVCHSYGV